MVKIFWQKNRIRIAVATCVAYVLLLFFLHDINKYLNGVFLLVAILLIAICFSVIVVNIVVEFYRIFRQRDSLSFQLAWPGIIYATTLFYSFSPIHISSAPPERDIILLAFFKGTQNQAEIAFYEDHEFETHWTGVFGYSKYFYGTYQKVNDTFLLHYKTDKPMRVGFKLLNTWDQLISLDSPVKEGQYFVSFNVALAQSELNSK